LTILDSGQYNRGYFARYVNAKLPTTPTPTAQQQAPGSSQPPSLKRFKFLVQQLQSSTPMTVRSAYTPADELADYISNMMYDAGDYGSIT